MSEAELYELITDNHIRGGDYYMQDMSPLRYGGAHAGAYAGYGTKKGAKKNPWLVHLKKVRAMYPHLRANEVAKLAAMTYKKEAPKKKKKASPRRRVRRPVGGIYYDL